MLNARTGLRGDWKDDDVRNFAMSISREAATLGRRFMFLSLLCNGVGTAVVLLALDYGLCLSLAPHSVAEHPNLWPAWVTLMIASLTAVCFFARGNEFAARAASAPIDIAASELAFRK